MKKTKIRFGCVGITLTVIAIMGPPSVARAQLDSTPLSVSSGNWTTTNNNGVFSDTWESGGRRFSFLLGGQLAWSMTGNQPSFEIQFSGLKMTIPDGTELDLNLTFDDGHALKLSAEAGDGGITAELASTLIPAWTHSLVSARTLTVDGLPGGSWKIPLDGTKPTIAAMVDAVGFSGATNLPVPFNSVAYDTGLVFSQPILEMGDFKQSGYWFIVFDRKITRPDTSIPDATQVTTIEVQIPQIINPLTVQAVAFNKRIIQSISMNSGNFGLPNFKYVNPHNNYLVTAGLSSPGKAGAPSVPDMLPGVASFGIDILQYCTGCSVQRSWPTPINWIIAKARPVDAEDIFDPKTNWQQALTDQACTRSTGCGLLYLTNLPVEAAFPPNWLLSRRGILIMFSAKYPASNMYEGTEGSVLVPWSSLKPYLKKGGLVPAGS